MELRWTKVRERFDLLPQKSFLSRFKVNVYLFLVGDLFWRGTKVISDANWEQRHVWLGMPLCFVFSFWVIFYFVLNILFLSKGLDFYLLKCKLQTGHNECLSQVWRGINGLCSWFQFRFAFFSSFLFWLFRFEHKPLNFISFCWKFCLVCFFFLFTFLDLVWNFVLLFFW